MDTLAQLRTALADRYVIEREIGAGGMATVFLARDLRHDRHVALKLLKPDLGAVLGVERFLGEIRVTAHLQHPNLLPLYDSGEADGLLFYVMPFVEGESLRARIHREKQLPVDEAIRISTAIANALDYAHQHGVIHRDLKPENILMQAGQPVVADFGIALAVSNAGGNRITQTGLSLGTPQYMSPEQATGDRVIDGRSDIYALAAVTYEMLTGEPPHTGSTAQAIIARVLTEKPRSIRSSRPAVPEHVDATIQHALEKLPADRFSTAREFADALNGHGTTGPSTVSLGTVRAPAHAPWRARFGDPVLLTTAAVAVAALVAAAALALRTPALIATHVVRFVMSTPDSLRPIDNFPWPAAISLDGGTMVFSARIASGVALHELRTDQLEPRAIPGTEGAYQPLFSPDGQWVAFEQQNKLKKVRLDGSSPIAITGAGSANGADWTTTDQIVLGAEGDSHGLSRVSAAGGDLAEFAHPDKSKGESDYLWPIAERDGKTIVFTIWSGTLASARLATATFAGDVRPLGLKGIRPLAVVDRMLVYVQADGSVMGVRLNRSGRELAGQPAPVLDPVGVPQGNNGNSEIFVSRGGALVSSRGGSRSRLSWIARDGSVHAISDEVHAFATPRLSPDGSRIAMVIAEGSQSGVWIYDLPTSTLSRLSSSTSIGSPRWAPDGKRVLFIAASKDTRYAIWSQPADGGSRPEELFDPPVLTSSIDISPDGRSLLFTTLSNNTWDIFRVRLDSDRVARPYLTSSADEQEPAFSPDGRWVAMVSNESGRREVYLRSFPDPSARVQVSAGGGTEPVWSRDGSHVFYRDGRVLMAATLATTPSLRVIARETVIPQFVPGEFGPVASYDVDRTGTRFVGLVSVGDDYQLVVVPNWRAELEQRLAQGAVR